MGTVVDLAHRLVDIAGAGEIVISSDIYNEVYSNTAVSNKLDVEIANLPEVTLKGIPDPQFIAYALLRSQPP